MTLYVDGEWSGWGGDTIVKLTNGTVWQQVEYYYEYRYAYHPEIVISTGNMIVKGMRTAVRVQQLV